VQKTFPTVATALQQLWIWLCRRPTPNIDEPKREPGMELALIGVPWHLAKWNLLKRVEAVVFPKP
jgi:hypothetical protein